MSNPLGMAGAIFSVSAKEDEADDDDDVLFKWAMLFPIDAGHHQLTPLSKTTDMSPTR